MRPTTERCFLGFGVCCCERGESLHNRVSETMNIPILRLEQVHFHGEETLHHFGAPFVLHHRGEAFKCQAASTADVGAQIDQNTAG